MKSDLSVSVIGAGTWGTALAILLDGKGYDVTLWSHDSEKIEKLKQSRSDLPNLPGAVLRDSVKLTDDLASSAKDKDIIVLAVSSVHVRDMAHKLAPYLSKGQKIVNVSKGFEESTLLTLSEVIKQELPMCDISVLSGPSHAEEVSRKIPTTCVVASETEETACFLQDVFMTERFRVYTSPDTMGVEIGGALKNVIALAAGISDGLGFGDNTKAALMTRGIAEIGRLGAKMGGKFETFSGLSGIGDLVVTCTSKHSRNWNAGYLIGKGCGTEEAKLKVGQAVEGINTAKAALMLAKKYDVDMPIVEQVNCVLFEDKPAIEAVTDLFMRDKKQENKQVLWTN